VNLFLLFTSILAPSVKNKKLINHDSFITFIHVLFCDGLISDALICISSLSQSDYPAQVIHVTVKRFPVATDSHSSCRKGPIKILYYT